MLEKKYATDHDGTYSYIDPVTATVLPLTPFMMKEWAWALVRSIPIALWCIYSPSTPV
jgi:hypothetical protein